MDYAYRILAVDDEPDILRTNRRYLEAQGYQVDTAACASEALEHLKNQNYDAILLDVLLPDRNGFALCEAIRALTSAPILFLSCMDEEEDKIEGLMAGGDDYITKPYSLKELAALYGDESSSGAAELLAGAEQALSRVERVDESIGALHRKISDLMYAAQDAAEELRDTLDGLSYSAEELEEIESRLDTIHRLKRKYGVSCEEILQFLENAKTQLDEIEFASDRIERLEKQLHKAKKEAEDAALALRAARKETAEKLQIRIQTELAQLDMPKIRFACQFEEIPLSPTGMDGVRFLMSANVGEALKPLSKVASGGELARIMLAMKNVLAEQDAVQTLIFDEVDAGVSGRAAQKVAEKLSDVARGKQVLCVTHLPQIAAMADTHFIVEKRVENDRTYTSVLQLSREERRKELARITGGAEITPVLLQGAEELLAAADRYKAEKCAK